MDIKDPQKAQDLYKTFQATLDEYTNHATSGEMAFEIEDPSVIKLWKSKIKPIADEIDPLVQQLLEADKIRAEKEKEYKEIIEKCEDINSEINNLRLKQNKFLTRVSPIIIRKYQSTINEYQQFGSIIEKDGRVYVTVKDWLASFIAGFKKKAENHHEKVTSKITNTKIVANE